VETQLQLARQEAARWKSQAEHASRAAEEARAELAVMAEWAHKGLQKEEDHKALMAQVGRGDKMVPALYIVKSRL
jgi:hypothetical protein